MAKGTNDDRAAGRVLSAWGRLLAGLRERQQARTLIYLGLALLALVLLSASLAQVNLLPGRPLPLSSIWPAIESPQELGGAGGSVIVALMRGLIGLSLVLLPVAVIYLIVSPQARKRFLTNLMIFLPILAFFYALTRLQLGDGQGRQGEQQTPGQMPDGQMFTSFDDFVAHPPAWLFWLASFFLLILLSALVAVTVAILTRRRAAPGALEQVAQQAEIALHALQAGADLRNVVIRCYLDMTRVLNEQRGIKRQAAMTPHEFQAHLERLGLPAWPVEQLTQLFEDVRYGALPPGEREAQLAVFCLQSIVKAARSPA
jgi:hypothetical protein